MRQHFHRCPNLRVVSVDASDIAGNRKGGSVILDELCQAKGLSRCVGLADCDILADGQRRELLVARLTELRSGLGGASAVEDPRGARAKELAEFAQDLYEERDELLTENRRLLAERTAAFDDRADTAPLETDEDLSPDLSTRDPELRSSRLDAIDRGLDAMFSDPSLYGVCAGCSTKIDAERLLMAPDTRVCRACAMEARSLD